MPKDAIFQALGMETVIFGAGSIDQAHQPDEFVEENTCRLRKTL